jgi:hypothetical protein
MKTLNRNRKSAKNPKLDAKAGLPNRKPCRKKETKKPPQPAAIEIPRSPDAPHWIPDNDAWNTLPKKTRLAVSKILAPAYRRFVLDADDELERTVGMTLVHLIWLEICDQLQMAGALADPLSLDAVINDSKDMVERHIRLAAAKCQSADLMLKVRMINRVLLSQTVPSPLGLPSPVQILEATAVEERRFEDQDSTYSNGPLDDGR